MARAKKFVLDELKNWEPDSNDFSYGRFLMMVEDCSKLTQQYSPYPDDMFSPENMLFSELVYVILSLRNTFSANKQQFHMFLNGDLGAVNNVLKNPERLEYILGKHGMGQKKYDAIMSAAKNWKSLDITNKMRKDQNKKFGPELREEMTDKIHGVGFKFASLFLRMCGYENISPPDTWAIYFCESRGYVYKRDDSGLNNTNGLQYENILKKYAKQFNVSPALFQATIYARFSTWKKDAKVSPEYY